MPKVPSENYERIVAALGRLGFVVVRQRGSHIRLEKLLVDGTLKITVPAHRPVKRSTLAKILKQADISLPDFLNARYSLTHAPVAAGVAEVARLQIGTLASSATVV